MAKVQLPQRKPRTNGVQGGNGGGPLARGRATLTSLGKQRLALVVLGAVMALAIVGWVAAKQIRSPAQIAADTAPPKASPITVPVLKRVLSSEVIVRGTVRYGAPQDVVLGTSRITNGSNIVTRRPRRNEILKKGSVAMMVDGRPVFVLPGAIPMHRDLHPGLRGADVRQLERDLKGLGFNPGPVDGVYDSATGAAVSAFYLHKGWDPYGLTDVQRDQLRTAESAAAAADDAYLNALHTARLAREGAAPADIAQAKIDAGTARDAAAAAALALENARTKLSSARDQAASAQKAVQATRLETWRDQQAADADVAAKRGALQTAMDDERVARVRRDDLPPDASAGDREAAAAAVRQAQESVARAQSDVNVAQVAAASARATRLSALSRARSDAARAADDVRDAAAELARARTGLEVARRQATLAAQRARVLAQPAPDTGTLDAITASARQEAGRARAALGRLAAENGVQVPADEILFFPTLPLRVDAVQAKRGATVNGRVMTVTNSRLAVDSSLSISDANLVRQGNTVAIEQQELGIKAKGRVTRVADKPGTNKVDPTRVYFEVTPAAAPLSLVGTSVKLTISVKSTHGPVLAVPASALSLGGDGSTRLQVRRGGRTRLVTVVPGLAAAGLVEVRPTVNGSLSPGDLVIVGTRDRTRSAIGAGSLR